MNIIDNVSTRIAHDVHRIREVAHTMGLDMDVNLMYDYSHGDLLYVYLRHNGSFRWDNIVRQILEYADINDVDYSEDEATISIEGYDIAHIGDGAAIILYIQDYSEKTLTSNEIDAIFYLVAKKI